jgi:hypothetical protein
VRVGTTERQHRRYLDPGDRLSGRQDPPRPCRVLTWWGSGGGPRNVLVRYGDGSQAVIPFPRRLRRAPASANLEEITGGQHETDPARSTGRVAGHGQTA